MGQRVIQNKLKKQLIEIGSALPYIIAPSEEGVKVTSDLILHSNGI